MKSSIFIQECIGAILLIGFAFLDETNGDTDIGGFEFGRELKNLGPSEDVKVKNFRNLFAMETNMMFSMSMSTSMSMTYDPTEGPDDAKDVTLAPVVPTSPPSSLPSTSSSTVTGAPPNEDELPPTAEGPDCTGQNETVVSILLEVEIATGAEDFHEELALAMEKALAEEYDFCPSRRRSYRNLEDEAVFLLGNTTVVGVSNETCSPQNEEAADCLVVRADIPISSTTYEQNEQEMIHASVESIAENDQAFDDELSLHGIVDVKTRSDAYSEAALDGPVKTSSPGRNAAITLLSVAAGTIVAAVALRKLLLGRITEPIGLFKDEEAQLACDGSANDETAAVTLHSRPQEEDSMM